MKKIYFSTVALEKNRWTPDKIPSYNASTYVKKAVKDGFAGVELWENHFHLADDAEKNRLITSGAEYIFNTYFNLAEGMTDNIKAVADAINTLGAVALKFNFANNKFGTDKDALMSQRDTLLRFADMIPGNVKLLCECHPMTPLEVPEVAAEMFYTLDERFGAIVHLNSETEFVKKIYECYGDRVCHIHSSARLPNKVFIRLCEKSEVIDTNMNFMLSKGFNGTITTEFVKEDPNLDICYENALIDREYLLNLYK